MLPMHGSRRRTWLAPQCSARQKRNGAVRGVFVVSPTRGPSDRASPCRFDQRCLPGPSCRRGGRRSRRRQHSRCSLKSMPGLAFASVDASVALRTLERIAATAALSPSYLVSVIGVMTAACSDYADPPGSLLSPPCTFRERSLPTPRKATQHESRQQTSGIASANKTSRWHVIVPRRRDQTTTGHDQTFRNLKQFSLADGSSTPPQTWTRQHAGLTF